MATLKIAKRWWILRLVALLAAPSLFAANSDALPARASTVSRDNPTVQANPLLGTVLAGPFVPVAPCATGNGWGIAFDGTNLYYTIVGDSNIYKINTAGTLCLARISVCPESIPSVPG